MTDHFIKSVVKGLIYAVIGSATVWILMNSGVFQYSSASFPAVPNDKWQAVFMQNGQVYFGKLANLDSQYVALTQVYYLKEASDLQQSNLNLVKLGGELHGPEDAIYIPKSQISFWENMKDTSRVVQSIEGAKK